MIAPFDYKALARDQAKMAKDAAVFIESRHRNLSAAVLEIGQKLIDVKAALGHGHFTAWVQSEFTMTMRTAQSYMSAVSGVLSTAQSLLR